MANNRNSSVTWYIFIEIRDVVRKKLQNYLIVCHCIQVGSREFFCFTKTSVQQGIWLVELRCCPVGNLYLWCKATTCWTIPRSGNSAALQSLSSNTTTTPSDALQLPTEYYWSCEGLLESWSILSSVCRRYRAKAVAQTWVILNLMYGCLVDNLSVWSNELCALELSLFRSLLLYDCIV